MRRPRRPRRSDLPTRRGRPQRIARRRRGAERQTSARPRLPLRDLLAESMAGLVARPARVALTVLGTVVGVAALVATLGLS
jgi:putative ABC transport system permease protein